MSASNPSGRRSATPPRVAAPEPYGIAAGLPPGSRDLLPSAYRRRRASIRALVEVFERWGYGPVMTPLVEYYDVLGRGLTEADRRLCVRFIEAGSGELVALRSDVTPQIARMVAQRLGGELEEGSFVRRYCYAAGVIRQSMAGSNPGADAEQTESHQAGVELIGDGDPAADAELVALCDEALRASGLHTFRIDLAHARIGHDLLASLELPDAAAERLRGLLARKDREGVRELVARHDRQGPAVDAAVALCDLFGAVEHGAAGAGVLDRARDALEHCGLGEGLERLEAVLAHLRGQDEAVLARITVDLGEVRGFEYYTGIRMRVWAPGVGRPIARGGRYDHLLGSYGAPAPATGFAIDLDALEAAMQRAGAGPGGQPSMPAHLVVSMGDLGEGGRIEASKIARGARSRGQRSWVVTAAASDSARAQAERAGAQTMSIVSGLEGGFEVHTWLRAPDGWREAKQDNPEREP